MFTLLRISKDQRDVECDERPLLVLYTTPVQLVSKLLVLHAPGLPESRRRFMARLDVNRIRSDTIVIHVPSLPIVDNPPNAVFKAPPFSRSVTERRRKRSNMSLADRVSDDMIPTLYVSVIRQRYLLCSSIGGSFDAAV